MKYLLFLMFSMISSTLFGMDFLHKFFNNIDPMLVANIKALPIEVRGLIFGMYMEAHKTHNKVLIKEYLEKASRIVAPSCHYVTQYFSFRNYGSECTHIIAFYPEFGSSHDHGVGRTADGDFVVLGAFAFAMIHTLKNKKINTIDCLQHQIRAPRCYNGIQLAQKKPGRVDWLNSALGGRRRERYCILNDTKEKRCAIVKCCAIL